MTMEELLSEMKAISKLKDEYYLAAYRFSKEYDERPYENDDIGDLEMFMATCDDKKTYENFIKWMDARSNLIERLQNENGFSFVVAHYISRFH